MIDKIRDHSRTLVEEVETLTRELVSVSMLWGDIWNEAIDCKYSARKHNLETVLNWKH